MNSETINWDEVEYDDIPSEVREEVIGRADPEDIMRICISQEADFYKDNFYEVDRQRIHPSVYLPKCFADGEQLLWFKNTKLEEIEKFLYYIGADNRDEAEIIWCDGINTMYKIQPSRMSFCQEKEKA